DASHELRTPISLIRTEAELTLRRPRGVEEYRAALEHILAESERTSQLLESLLGIARADAGRELLDLQDIDLKLLVLQAAEAWTSAARSCNLVLHCVVPETGVLVRGDSTALRRVIDVLIDNAVKYAKERGSVVIRLYKRQGSVAVIIEDDGIGIPSEEQSKIFERFYRVDKARSRSLGGAGLGLAIANWIVHQHRGAIRVESIEGEGSKF